MLNLYQSGAYCFQVACYRGHLEIVNFLLNADKDFDADWCTQVLHIIFFKSSYIG